MIWLTWRQFRGSAAIVLGAMAVAVVALAVTGPQLADVLRDSGEDFFTQLSTDDVKKGVFLLGTALAYAVPAVVGAFWGAPMVARELEAGTHRLVWNQSITRSRWLVSKLGVAVAGAVLAGCIGLVMTWWSGPLDDALMAGYTDNSPFSLPRVTPDFFGARGVVPIGMTLLALVVGVSAGLLVRRTVAAMALTLATVVAVQILMPVFVQARLMEPETFTTTISSENIRGFMMSGEPDAADPKIEVEVAVGQLGAWVTDNRTLGPDGQQIQYLPARAEACAPDPRADPAEVDACFAALAADGYRQQVDYHPAAHFWGLQWRETGLLLVLAAGLTGFCFWRIRRDFT
ncbi:MAG: ABC transporter permease [Acidimicrobiales bacterium]